jgi:hypothetical protein
VPGAFYLPGPPISTTVPGGWTANISGHSIQFVANSPADDIKPGQSLSGFGYEAHFTPAQLAAAPKSGLSVAYSGALFSDTGNYFSVQTVPEPSTLLLLLCGAAGLWAVRRPKRQGVFRLSQNSGLRELCRKPYRELIGIPPFPQRLQQSLRSSFPKGDR